MANDLYNTLGIEKNANEQEIKRAYRRLAREYHPDVNKSAGADEKFKEVQSAYDVLSDPKKRARYDQFGVTDDQAGFGGGGGGFGGFEGFSGAGGFEDAFGDIFESFFGGSRGGGRGSSQAGEDLRYELSITLEDASKGLKKTIELFYLDLKEGSTRSCAQCNGVGYVEVVQRTILGSVSQRTACPACHGTGGIERQKKKKTLDIQIPAGVETGMKLRVTGEGNIGIGGGPRGDLYVVITVKDHDVFKRNGNDLYLDVPVPLSMAVLGATLRVPTLDGKTDLKVPSGTQPGTRFRLKGKGIKNIKGFGSGDMYVVINVDIPTNLSREEKDCFQKISKIRNDEERLSSVLESLT